MTPVLVEFLVGLYFVVADSPVLFARPLTVGPLIRFILVLQRDFMVSCSLDQMTEGDDEPTGTHADGACA